MQLAVLIVGVAFPAIAGIGLVVIAFRSGRRSRRRFRQAVVQATILESFACGLLSAVLLLTYHRPAYSFLLLIVGVTADVVGVVCALSLITQGLLALHFGNLQRRGEPRQ